MTRQDFDVVLYPNKDQYDPMPGWVDDDRKLTAELMCYMAAVNKFLTDFLMFCFMKWVDVSFAWLLFRAANHGPPTTRREIWIISVQTERPAMSSPLGR